MSIQGQIIVILLCFFISFLYIRGFLYGVKRFQLNNSAYKKKKKQESFIEWLTYSRYKDEIPKIALVFYFSILLIHLICIIVCVICYIINQLPETGQLLAKIVFYFDMVWIIAVALLFWSPGRGYAYERWITKKRGQK